MTSLMMPHFIFSNTAFIDAFSLNNVL